MTDQILNEDQLKEIEDGLKGVPDGPWISHRDEFVSQSRTLAVICRVNTPTVADWSRGKYVASTLEHREVVKRFIARSRTDVPALIAALRQSWERERRLQAEVNRYRTLLEGRIAVRPIITRSQYGTWSVKTPLWSISCNGSEDTRPDDEVITAFQKKVLELDALLHESEGENNG